jgi:hypothetical protein
MNGSGNLNWLVWKEYRQNRLIVYAALCLLLVPYVLVIYAMWGAWPFCGFLAMDRVHWRHNLITACVYSLLFSQVALAMLGGNLIAGERVDRSAEFQSHLPIRRRKIFAAKMLAVVLLMAIIWLPNVTVLCAFADTVKFMFRGWHDILGVLSVTAATGIMALCVAWLFSSFLASATISACAGILAPIAVLSGLWLEAYLRDVSDYPIPSYMVICSIVSSLAFAAGTRLYLRRVEP